MQDYRRVQILAQAGNALQQKSLVTVIVVGAILVQSICMTFLIRGKWTIGTGFAMGESVLHVGNCVSILLMYTGGLASIYGESKDLLQKRFKEAMAKQGQSRRMTRYVRRFIKSCPLIKIKFGSLNFFDELTPLKCIDFANHLTVNTLLLTSA